MKKLLTLLLGFLLIPTFAFAQVNVVQGGTGLVAIPKGTILTGNVTIRALATSTDPLYVGGIFATSSSLVSNFYQVLFQGSTTLQNATSTNFGATNSICIASDCRTAWPTSASSFAWPWTKQADNGQATSTLIEDWGGLLSASTTVTSFTLAGVATGCATFTTGALSSTGVACGSGGGSFAFPWTKQADGGMATSTLVEDWGGFMTASSTFTQPITAPNVASTTIVFANHCDAQVNAVDNALAGGSFFNAEVMSNNNAALVGLHLTNATTSEMTCWYIIPHTTSSSTMATNTTGTSSAGFVNLDLYHKDINPIGGSYDPSLTSVVLDLNASTTPANRLAIGGGTQWLGYGTTTSITGTFNAGDVVAFIWKRWSRASGDTYNGDVIFPTNPFLITQN